MLTIVKEFHFSASHQLDHLPDGHPCARLHGHNYIVRIGLTAAATDERGFVADFGELKPLKEWIDSELDHRHLNDVLGSGIATTSENMARTIYEQAEAVLFPRGVIGDRVRIAFIQVCETPKTSATYVP